MKGPFLFDDYSDLTSPASNHMPDTCIDIAVSVEYDTLENYFSYLYRGKKILKFSLVPRASTSIFLLVLLPNNLSKMFCPIPSIQGKINLH